MKPVDDDEGRALDYLYGWVAWLRKNFDDLPGPRGGLHFLLNQTEKKVLEPAKLRGWKPRNE